MQRLPSGSRLSFGLQGAFQDHMKAHLVGLEQSLGGRLQKIRALNTQKHAAFPGAIPFHLEKHGVVQRRLAGRGGLKFKRDEVRSRSVGNPDVSVGQVMDQLWQVLSRKRVTLPVQDATNAAIHDDETFIDGFIALLFARVAMVGKKNHHVKIDDAVRLFDLNLHGEGLDVVEGPEFIANLSW